MKKIKKYIMMQFKKLLKQYSYTIKKKGNKMYKI